MLPPTPTTSGYATPVATVFHPAEDSDGGADDDDSDFPLLPELPEETESLFEDLRSLQASAEKKGNICFRLPSGQEEFSFEFLFSSKEIKRLSHATKVTTSRDVIHRTVAPEHIAALNRRLDLGPESYAEVLTALKERYDSLEAAAATTPHQYYCIYLNDAILKKRTGNEKTVAKLRIHRGLLEARIPYFAALFRSGMKDSDSKSGVLYSDAIPNPEALKAVAKWCYHVFEESNAGEKCEEWAEVDEKEKEKGKEKEKKFSKLPPPRVKVKSQPPPKVVELIHTAVAADYLSATKLLRFSLREVEAECHGFTCRGYRCADNIPTFLNTLSKYPAIHDAAASMHEKALSLLARPDSVSRMWKRGLVMCHDEVLEDLVLQIQAALLTGNSELAFKWVLAIVKLKSRIAASNVKDRWERLLLAPLMESVIFQITIKLEDGYLKRRVERLYDGAGIWGFERQAIEETISKMVAKVSPENARLLWKGLWNMLAVEPIIKARDRVGDWWNTWWITLAVDGYFEYWDQDDRDFLASELDIDAKDLQGTPFKVRGLDKGIRGMPVNRGKTKWELRNETRRASRRSLS
ncbi:hypothetical protein FN846DRAFT_243544 [Sphaerosporella brunnea]|uniref:BTB domain-containing protein n=1 Tax=Sphaerosporella brunnea TaxID=1250544 RepID=A0A5J5FB31_9PEZI|nr:hypothetical protein FN846DRAFT_243544 [Sphaerosporella brunnea]